MSAAASPDPLPPFAAYHPAADAGLSMAELRTAIQQRLRHTGALRTLKTQLRGMVLTDLMKNRRLAEGRGQPAMTLEEFERCRQTVHDHVHDKATSALHHAAAGGADAGGAVAAQPPPPPLPSTWPGRIADCLIHNHLIRSARNMSLSIFATEAEVPPLSDSGAPADEELFLCQLLGLPAGAGVEEEEPGRDGGMPRQQPSSFKSALQLLVEEALCRRGQPDDPAAHRHQCGTQTDDFSPTSEETNPLTSMECRLAAVDAKYALTFSQLRQGGAAVTWRGEVERRLAQYKEELHSLLRAEYQQKYRTFEQTKLHECKAQMEEHYQTLREHHRQELEEKERTLVAKAEQDRQRLTHIREDLEQQRLRLERKQLDLITFQQEMEGEVEKLHVQLRDQRDKIQTLRFQCEKWEELCGSRLMEAESARAREMRRLEELRCAKAEHATEVHLLEEEIRHLRFRVQVLSQGGGAGMADTAEEATAAAEGGPASRRGAESLHYPVSASRRAGAIPSYYFSASGAGAGPEDGAVRMPDDVETFIHRTERSQREEQTRLQAGVGADVRQTFIAAQHEQQQQQQQAPPPAPGLDRLASSPLSSSYRSPLSGNQQQPAVFQQQQQLPNGAGDGIGAHSAIETSSFLARNSSSFNGVAVRGSQEQQQQQQQLSSHQQDFSRSSTNNNNSGYHNNYNNTTHSSVLQGSSSSPGGQNAFRSNPSNLNPSSSPLGSAPSSPSTSQLWPPSGGVAAPAAGAGAGTSASASAFTGPSAASSPERAPPFHNALTSASASSSPEGFGKPSVAETSSYRPEESPSTVRSQSPKLVGAGGVTQDSGAPHMASQTMTTTTRESAASGTADSAAAAATTTATSTSADERRESAQVTGTNVDASSISAAQQTPTGSQQIHLPQRSEGSSLLAMAAKVLKPRKSSSSSSTTTTTSASSSSSSSSSTSSKKRKQKSSVGDKPPVVNEAALRAKTSKLSSEEATARISVVNEEEDAFKGIAWSARSQLSVLQSKRQAEQNPSSSNSSGSNSSRSSRGRGTTWMMEQAAAARLQRQQEEDNIIYRDSDDDDSILYNSNSTSSSF